MATPATTLNLRGREVVVATTRLTMFAAPFRTTALAQPHPRCLELHPSAAQRVFASFFLGLGLLLFAVGLGGIKRTHAGLDVDWLRTVGGLSWGLALIAVGVWQFSRPSYHVFDQGAGHWVHEGILWDAARPLTDILAVQLLYAKRLNGDEVWELNFILDDGPRARLNLASHTKLRETLHQAERLAGFLGVPLLRHTEGAAGRPSSRKRVDLSSAITVLAPSTSWHIKAAAKPSDVTQ